MKVREYAAAIRAGDDPEAILTLAQQEARAAALEERDRGIRGVLLLLIEMQLPGNGNRAPRILNEAIASVRALLEGK